MPSKPIHWILMSYGRMRVKSAPMPNEFIPKSAMSIHAHPDDQDFTVSGGSAGAAPLEGFRQGLRELGYLQEKNIVLEYRAADPTGSIEKTARFLRHRDTATTAKHYLHIDAEELRGELSQIEIWRG